MLKLEIKVADGSSKDARVSGSGMENDVIVKGGQTKTVEVGDDGTIKVIAYAPDDEVKTGSDGKPLTTDAPGVHGNPNGIQQAVIGPKMPHTGGQTEIVSENGRLLERSVGVDPAQERQGGGPDSTDGKTPGPKVAGEEGEKASATLAAKKK